MYFILRRVVFTIETVIYTWYCNFQPQWFQDQRFFSGDLTNVNNPNSTACSHSNTLSLLVTNYRKTSFSWISNSYQPFPGLISAFQFITKFHSLCRCKLVIYLSFHVVKKSQNSLKIPNYHGFENKFTYTVVPL